MIVAVVLALLTLSQVFTCRRLLRSLKPGASRRISRSAAVVELVSGGLVLAASRAGATTALPQWLWVVYLVSVVACLALTVVVWPSLPIRSRIGRPG